MTPNDKIYAEVDTIVRGMTTNSGKSYVRTLCSISNSIIEMVYKDRITDYSSYEQCVKKDIADAMKKIQVFNSDTLQNEVMEQARLLKISAERECVLSCEIERLKKQILVLESKVEPVYEEFIPQKDYPVGGFFKIGNEVFKVVTGDGETCTSCEFEHYNRGYCGDFACDIGNVTAILYDVVDQEVGHE